MMRFLLSLALVAGPAFAQGSANDKVCQQYIVTIFQDELSKATQQIYKLDEADRAANSSKAQAEKLGTELKNGLGEEERKHALSMAKFGEETSRIRYCGQCKDIHQKLKKLKGDLKANCQNPKVQPLVDEVSSQENRLKKACREKAPYDQLCKPYLN